MEIAVGFHFLTTTTHPPNVNLPSLGQQVTSRLSAHKVSVAGGGGGTGPKTPWSGTLQCGGVITQEKDMTSTHTYVILNKCSF